MKKVSFIALILFIAFSAKAQGKYATKTGSISFEASVPSFEPVAAQHDNVSALLNAQTGEFAALALVNGFHFEIALMEEHFNENYMESSEFPKAVFKGILVDFDEAKIKETPVALKLDGTITIHGVTRPLIVEVSLNKIAPDSFEFQTEFDLNPEDFNIAIPKIVRSKIAEKVQVQCSFELKAK